MAFVRLANQLATRASSASRGWLSHLRSAEPTVLTTNFLPTQDACLDRSVVAINSAEPIEGTGVTQDVGGAGTGESCASRRLLYRVCHMLAVLHRAALHRAVHCCTDAARSTARGVLQRWGVNAPQGEHRHCLDATQTPPAIPDLLPSLPDR